MQSPVGSNQQLERVELEEGLVAFRCPETGGHWIPAQNYWKWQQKMPPVAREENSAGFEEVVSEFDDVLKLCPETRTFMSRYRVGHGLPFRIERSVSGGVWLDGGEWEALRKRNLHHSLHLVFTAPWQKEVCDEKTAAAADVLLKEKLGEELLGRLAELRKELAGHPARAEALAYLQIKESE